MAIGTAKPTADQLTAVPHHLIDVVDANKQLNIHQFVERAREAVMAIHKRGKRALVTGGSGFYLKAFFAPVVDRYSVDAATREYVQSIENAHGLDGLLASLRELNPVGLGSLDKNNPRRVSRALERCLVSGKTLIEQEKDFATQTSPFAEYGIRCCLLMRSKASLATRISQRTRLMIDQGLVDEVQSLLKGGIEENPSAYNAIGYRETIQWLREGSGDRQALESAICQSTRQLVARQMKWFRTQLKPDRILDLDRCQFEPDDFRPLLTGR